MVKLAEGIAPEGVAWVAGLLEGEGSFSTKGTGTAKNIVVSCHMTDLDVLQKLKSICGTGRIHGPYRNGPPEKNWKPRYLFQVVGADAYALMARILPLMGSRRSARIRELMAGYDSVATKVYVLQYVETGGIESTTNLKEWLSDHGISGSGLYRTMIGQRKQCKGWRRIQ